MAVDPAFRAGDIHNCTDASALASCSWNRNCSSSGLFPLRADDLAAVVRSPSEQSSFLAIRLLAGEVDESRIRQCRIMAALAICDMTAD